MEGSSPNTSGVGPNGWNNWRGCQNLNLLSVSKKISGNLTKLPVFLGFEPFSLSNSESEWKLVVPTPDSKVQKAFKIDVAVRFWVYLALAIKNERKTNKNSRFLGFLAHFVIKQWSREESSSPNNSVVGPHGWSYWRGCQNLSLLSVSKESAEN